MRTIIHRNFRRFLRPGDMCEYAARRLGNAPAITPDMLPGNDGENINGPSVIRVPSWIDRPLGKYYLYFAHHKGTYIRLAYANTPVGPWTIYQPGSLHLTQTVCDTFPEGHSPAYPHIASPDVHVDDESQEIVMYFHGTAYNGSRAVQATFRAVSTDGITFTAENVLLGPPYLRVFQHNDEYYALGRLGVLYKSPDGKSPFEKGPNPLQKLLAPALLRHCAVFLRNSTLYAFFSCIGAQPEHIQASSLKLSYNWKLWTATRPQSVLIPQTAYEGADLPNLISESGMANEPVNQLRDPYIFEDDGKLYLFYCIAGESGIAIAEVEMF